MSTAQPYAGLRNQWSINFLFITIWDLMYWLVLRAELTFYQSQL